VKWGHGWGMLRAMVWRGRWPGRLIEVLNGPAEWKRGDGVPPLRCRPRAVEAGARDHLHTAGLLVRQAFDRMMGSRTRCIERS